MALDGPTVISYLILAIIAGIIGAFMSYIIIRLQKFKERRNFDHEAVLKSLTENSKITRGDGAAIYHDQPTTSGPARKMIYSLKEDPKTKKKVLHLEYEDLPMPKAKPKKATPNPKLKKEEIKKEDPKAEIKKEEIPTPPQDISKVDYSKVLNTPKVEESED